MLEELWNDPVALVKDEDDDEDREPVADPDEVDVGWGDDEYEAE
jgi:hypothetical protein